MASNSRKDPRGYVLRTGECYRKDGRYSYTYTNKYGERPTVYAKTLAELRKKEQTIRRDQEDGINTYTADKMTLNQLRDKYMSQKVNLRQNTINSYNFAYDRFVRESFGKRVISKICYSDIKMFYISIVRDYGTFSYVKMIQMQLVPAFKMAIRDDLIRINPASGVIGEVKDFVLEEPEPRHALTVQQQKGLMNFLSTNKKYYGWKPLITVLLGTGLRIGECLGLTWNDIDMENKFINVNHTLAYCKDSTGQYRFIINDPKTKAGIRSIPMVNEVRMALLEEYQISKLFYKECEIDGYSGFVFTNSNGRPVENKVFLYVINRIVEDYNKQVLKENMESREVLLIPHISAHIFRHTFCTRLCENEVNIKVIQTLMGHSDIKTTMNIYAEITKDKSTAVLEELENKILVM